MPCQLCGELLDLQDQFCIHYPYHNDCVVEHLYNMKETDRAIFVDKCFECLISNGQEKDMEIEWTNVSYLLNDVYSIIEFGERQARARKNELYQKITTNSKYYESFTWRKSLHKFFIHGYESIVGTISDDQ